MPNRVIAGSFLRRAGGGSRHPLATDLPYNRPQEASIQDGIELSIERARGTKQSPQQIALLRDKWPLAFPLEQQDVRPLAIGAASEICRPSWTGRCCTTSKKNRRERQTHRAGIEIKTDDKSFRLQRRSD
jgi:hypothetical protein